MPTKSFSAALAVAALTLGIAAAPTQAAPRFEGRSLADSLQKARQILLDVASGRANASDFATGSAAPEALTEAPVKALSDGAIVGTWLVDVPGDAPFRALQTFTPGGTFVETSDLLGHLPEGPAHGVYRRIANNRYALTFLVFLFDENGDPAGYVRVRARLALTNGGNGLLADTEVDVVTPDGELIPNVGGGPFTGVRLPLLGLSE